MLWKKLGLGRGARRDAATVVAAVSMCSVMEWVPLIFSLMSKSLCTFLSPAPLHFPPPPTLLFSLLSPSPNSVPSLLPTLSPSPFPHSSSFLFLPLHPPSSFLSPSTPLLWGPASPFCHRVWTSGGAGDWRKGGRNKESDGSHFSLSPFPSISPGWLNALLKVTLCTQLSVSGSRSSSLPFASSGLKKVKEPYS